MPYILTPESLGQSRFQAYFEHLGGKNWCFGDIASESGDELAGHEDYQRSSISFAWRRSNLGQPVEEPAFGSKERAEIGEDDYKKIKNRFFGDKKRLEEIFNQNYSQAMVQAIGGGILTFELQDTANGLSRQKTIDYIPHRSNMGSFRVEFILTKKDELTCEVCFPELAIVDTHKNPNDNKDKKVLPGSVKAIYKATSKNGFEFQSIECSNKLLRDIFACNNDVFMAMTASEFDKRIKESEEEEALNLKLYHLAQNIRRYLHSERSEEGKVYYNFPRLLGLTNENKKVFSNLLGENRKFQSEKEPQAYLNALSQIEYLPTVYRALQRHPEWLNHSLISEEESRELIKRLENKTFELAYQQDNMPTPTLVGRRDSNAGAVMQVLSMSLYSQHYIGELDVDIVNDLALTNAATELGKDEGAAHFFDEKTLKIYKDELLPIIVSKYGSIGVGNIMAMAEVYRLCDEIAKLPTSFSFKNPLQGLVTMEDPIGCFILAMNGNKEAIKQYLGYSDIPWVVKASILKKIFKCNVFSREDRKEIQKEVSKQRKKSAKRRDLDTIRENKAANKNDIAAKYAAKYLKSKAYKNATPNDKLAILESFAKNDLLRLEAINELWLQDITQPEADRLELLKSLLDKGLFTAKDIEPIANILKIQGLLKDKSIKTMQEFVEDMYTTLKPFQDAKLKVTEDVILYCKHKAAGKYGDAATYAYNYLKSSAYKKAELAKRKAILNIFAQDGLLNEEAIVAFLSDKEMSLMDKLDICEKNLNNATTFSDGLASNIISLIAESIGFKGFPIPKWLGRKSQDVAKLFIDGLKNNLQILQAEKMSNDLLGYCLYQALADTLPPSIYSDQLDRKDWIKEAAGYALKYIKSSAYKKANLDHKNAALNAFATSGLLNEEVINVIFADKKISLNDKVDIYIRSKISAQGEDHKAISADASQTMKILQKSGLKLTTELARACANKAIALHYESKKELDKAASYRNDAVACTIAYLKGSSNAEVVSPSKVKWLKVLADQSLLAIKEFEHFKYCFANYKMPTIDRFIILKTIINKISKSDPERNDHIKLLLSIEIYKDPKILGADSWGRQVNLKGKLDKIGNLDELVNKTQENVKKLSAYINNNMFSAGLMQFSWWLAIAQCLKNKKTEQGINSEIMDEDIQQAINIAKECVKNYVKEVLINFYCHDSDVKKQAAQLFGLIEDTNTQITVRVPSLAEGIKAKISNKDERIAAVLASLPVSAATSASASPSIVGRHLPANTAIATPQRVEPSSPVVITRAASSSSSTSDMISIMGGNASSSSNRKRAVPAPMTPLSKDKATLKIKVHRMLSEITENLNGHDPVSLNDNSESSSTPKKATMGVI